ncbi:MAG: hypothetical protein DRP85_09405 [Candidatus Makaraimicrobium thalassicum]|nr:MAG: hypothetical protein DRP85_09405 [Candidatus Omnitrophota bacterium]
MTVEVVSLLGKANKLLLGDCRFIGLSDGLKYARLDYTEVIVIFFNRVTKFLSHQKMSTCLQLSLKSYPEFKLFLTQ